MIDWSTIEQWVRDWLDIINYTFDNAIAVLSVSPFNSSIRIIDTAMTAVEGVALVMVSMFFAIQLCNDTMLLKLQSYEQIFKLFFKFILAKVIVQNAKGIMGILFNGFNSIAASLGDANYGFLSRFGVDAIIQQPADGGFLNLNYLLKYLETMPTFLILLGACWVINLILIGRLFEIIVYTVISPIPLATFAAEGWHDSAKAFVKSYAAVCLQGLVVIVMFYAFSQVTDLLGGSDRECRFGNSDRIFQQIFKGGETVFREEMKKLFIKQYGIVVMAMVLIGEIILINILYPQNDFESEYLQSVFEEYMAEFHGELTAEKRDDILAEQELILNAKNAISVLETKLYRGEFTDRKAFHAEYDELSAIILRSDAFDLILEKYYYALADTDKRFLTNGNYDGLNSDYPDFLMLAAIIIIAAIAFFNEENSNVSTLIRTSENGRRSAFKFKVIALAMFVFACQILRVICELFVMISRGETAELSFPVQSIEFFQNCPYDLTIAQCFLIISAVRLLGCFFIACIVMLLAVKLKSPLFTVFIPCSICLLQQFVFEPAAIAYCIPTGLLRAVGYVGGDISSNAENDSYSIGIPFELMIAVFFLTVIFIAISVIIVGKYYSCKKRTFKCKKMIVLLAVVIVCCFFSGCSYKEVSSVIYNAGDNFFVVQNDNHYFVSDEGGITRVDKSDCSEFQLIRDPFLSSAGVYGMSIRGRNLYCLDAFSSKKISVISLDTLSAKTFESGNLANYSLYSAFSNGESLFFTTFDEDGVYELLGNKIRKIIPNKIYNNQLSFDGRRFFYINGVLELVCYDTQTDEETILSEDFARAVYYDGTRVVFSTDKGIFALDNIDFSVKKLSEANAQKLCSDGEAVVFLDDGNLYSLKDEIASIYDKEPLYFVILSNSKKVILREFDQTLGKNVDRVIDLPHSSSPF